MFLSVFDFTEDHIHLLIVFVKIILFLENLFLGSHLFSFLNGFCCSGLLVSNQNGLLVKKSDTSFCFYVIALKSLFGASYSRWRLKYIYWRITNRPRETKNKIKYQALPHETHKKGLTLLIRRQDGSNIFKGYFRRYYWYFVVSHKEDMLLSTIFITSQCQLGHMFRGQRFKG